MHAGWWRHVCRCLVGDNLWRLSCQDVKVQGCRFEHDYPEDDGCMICSLVIDATTWIIFCPFRYSSGFVIPFYGSLLLLLVPCT